VKLTAVDLFSGIGGMARAVVDSGFELLLLCEIEPMCRSILAAHHPDTPIVEDVHDFTGSHVASQLLARGIEDGLTLLTGAFPVQANFTRGQRRERDTRSLWEQFARVALECRPAYVVVETLPRLAGVGLDDASWDLEREGYSTTAIHLPAQAVGCPLRKDRLYLVASRTDDPGQRPDDPGAPFALEGGAWDPPGPRLHRMAERTGRDVDEHIALSYAIGDATVPRAACAILGSIAANERDWVAAGGSR
jgi:site-specific DNA-cytosine methylase